MLSDTFGQEWEALGEASRRLVAKDFEHMVTAENWYDPRDAAREYRKNIGRGNLTSYASCLGV
jgi:hypothetical protein